MERLLLGIGELLVRCRAGNIAIAAGLSLMPLVLIAGFATDRDARPGSGISARAGLQASATPPSTAAKRG